MPEASIRSTRRLSDGFLRTKRPGTIGIYADIDVHGLEIHVGLHAKKWWLRHDVDPCHRVAVEAAENFSRTDFTLSEAVAIKRALQPKLPKFGKFEPARETVAGYTGFSHETLRKAEAVVEAAEVELQRFEKLRVEMDRTGRVDLPFKQLKIVRERDAYLERKQPGGTVADLKIVAE